MTLLNTLIVLLLCLFFLFDDAFDSSVLIDCLKGVEYSQIIDWEKVLSFYCSISFVFIDLSKCHLGDRVLNLHICLQGNQGSRILLFCAKQPKVRLLRLLSTVNANIIFTSLGTVPDSIRNLLLINTTEITFIHTSFIPPQFLLKLQNMAFSAFVNRWLRW